MAVERKYERDIDLLLAEEFVVSPEFAAWFLTRTRRHVGEAGDVKHVFVSRADSSGESDLVVIFQRRGSDGCFALLIEDKIDAPLQPAQEVRHKTRAERGVAVGEFDTYEVILCAPTAYCAAEPRTASFDCSVTYEEIGEYLRQSNPTPRGQYRARFISSAATLTASLWKKVDDAATSDFWDAAYRMAAQEFPVLEMKERDLTKDATWIVIRPSDMPTQPKWTYVACKGHKGHMDLTFSNTTLPAFHAAVSNLLPSDLTVHQTGKATAIRITVQPFRVSDGVAAGMPKVRRAFEAVTRLILFYREHRAELDEAAMKATAVRKSG